MELFADSGNNEGIDENLCKVGDKRQSTAKEKHVLKTPMADVLNELIDPIRVVLLQRFHREDIKIETNGIFDAETKKIPSKNADPLQSHETVLSLSSHCKRFGLAEPLPDDGFLGISVASDTHFTLVPNRAC